MVTARIQVVAPVTNATESRILKRKIIRSPTKTMAINGMAITKYTGMVTHRVEPMSNVVPISSEMVIPLYDGIIETITPPKNNEIVVNKSRIRPILMNATANITAITFTMAPSTFPMAIKILPKALNTLSKKPDRFLFSIFCFTLLISSCKFFSRFEKFISSPFISIRCLVVSALGTAIHITA